VSSLHLRAFLAWPAARLLVEHVFVLSTLVVCAPRKKEVDALFTGDNSGIDFDAYEDIPVEATGEAVPEPISSFADVDLGPGLMENVRRCKYTKPTPVQR
jgi:hypothetical protein